MQEQSVFSFMRSAIIIYILLLTTAYYIEPFEQEYDWHEMDSFESSSTFHIAEGQPEMKDATTRLFLDVLVSIIVLMFVYALQIFCTASASLENSLLIRSQIFRASNSFRLPSPVPLRI